MMKRREAIQNIALLAVSITLVPACNFEQGPVYNNVPLEKGQRTLIDLLTNALLPKEGTEITTPESTTDFLLTMLNDCTAPEDINKFLLGLKEFQEKVKTTYSTSFKKLDKDKQIELFKSIGEGPEISENIKHFFDTTLGMSRWHFTSSEHYMKTYREFEFAPGRYIGCKALS